MRSDSPAALVAGGGPPRAMDGAEPAPAGLRWLPDDPVLRWVVLGAIAVGSLLRAVGVDAVPLWLDELSTSWVVAGDGYADVLRRALSIESQPPLYYLAARAAVDVAGPGSLALRLPSLLFGIVTLALVFPLARAVLRRDDAAAIAVVVAAAYEPWILAAQEARPYGLAIALCAASMVAFLALLERDGAARRAAWVLACAGALYAQYLSAALVAVQAAYLLASRGRAALRDRRWLVGGTLLAAAAVPALVAVAGVASRPERHDWLAGLPWHLQLQGVATLFQPLALAAVALFLLAACGPPSGWTEIPARRRLLVLWVVVPVALFLALRATLGVQLLFPRYLFVVTPAAILSAAWLVALAPAGPRRRGALAAAVAVAFGGSLLPHLADVGAFSGRTRDGWTEVAARWRERAPPGEPNFVCTELVEADAVAAEPFDPLLASHLSWPLLADLEPARHGDVRALPRTLRPETEPYVRRLLAAVAVAPRVWMVGSDRCLGEVGRPFFDAGLAVAGVDRFGDQVLLELRRGAPSP